jgi:dipeptidyl-peptidase-4
MRKSTLFFTLFLLLTGTTVYAQRGEGGLNWTPDGKGYYEISNGSIVKTSLPDMTKTTLVTAAQLTPPKADKPLDLRGYAFSADQQKLLIYTNSKKVWRQETRGDYWVLDIAKNTIRQIGKQQPSSSLMFAKFSPDGAKVAYVSEYNLYVEELATGKTTALTKGGNRKLINGTFDWAYEEEFGCRDGFRWSPDSKKIAYWQIDASKVKTYIMLNTTDSIYPFPVPVEYPSAGEAPSPYKIGVVDIKTAQTVWMKLPTDPVLQSYVPRMEWAGNNTQLILQHLNRKQNESNLMLCDAATGNAVSILHETDAAWIDAAGSLTEQFWLKEGKEFLWTSDRDGWRHLYRISRDGKQQTLITKGNFDIMGGVKLDENNGYVYYYASPDNATQRYLYRSKLDGSANPERVSPANQNGTHTYNISPGVQFAQHSFSNYYTQPAREWLSMPNHAPMDGNKVNAAVQQADPAKSNLHFFKVKTEEGVEMDGWMVRPKNFDSTKKYPVVFFVYTEPAGQNAKDQFGSGSNRLYKGDMAADGYIYITIDNRGTPAPKGRAWRKSIYRKIGQVNIRDQALAAKEVMKWNYVDSSRIAVWGWSGGGSATLGLMFQYPEIYKTGISIAAVGNQLTYDNIYQERYMGLPQENREDFVKGSPITYAKNLRGHLLYIHGTGDDNVHYNNAEQLVNELIAQGKQFQMMSYPNRTHSISEGKGTNDHLRQLYTDYLKMYCPPGAR